jgi:hypothetical protein
MLRGRKSVDALSPDEYQQFSNMSLKAFWFFSAGHFQFRRGTIAESDWFEVLGGPLLAPFTTLQGMVGEAGSVDVRK